jgi:phospholipase/carboxylesterase
MAHGQFDPLILFNTAQHSRVYLEKLSYNVQWHTYNMQHNVSPEEVVDIGNWLTACLP